MKKFTKELQQKTVPELEHEIAGLREEITKTNLEMKTNMPKDTNTLTKKRKKLAALLTVLKEKKEAKI